MNEEEVVERVAEILNAKPSDLQGPWTPGEVRDFCFLVDDYGRLDPNAVAAEMREFFYGEGEL